MEEKNKVSIEMEDMVGKTYFQIATWYNQDFKTDKERQEALKMVSGEIIQQILEDTFLQIEGVKKTEMKTIKSNPENNFINPNVDGSNKMFEPTEDPILKAIRENK